MRTYLYLEGMNPEPWKAPGAQVGRRKGGVFATLIKDGRLAAYQEAIGEALDDYDVTPYPRDQYLQVEMFFWRQLEEYTPTMGRKSKRKWADATNMGKALEDAMQGSDRIYPNDAAVVQPIPRIMEQGDETEPQILVAITPVEMGRGKMDLHNAYTTRAIMQHHARNGAAFLQGDHINDYAPIQMRW